MPQILPVTKSTARCFFRKIAADVTPLRQQVRAPLAQAPPLREVYLKYPIEQLEYGFAEGMGSKHQEMPQIQFSSEQVSAILNYLGSITGVAPSARSRGSAPSETEPP